MWDLFVADENVLSYLTFTFLNSKHVILHLTRFSDENIQLLS